MSRYKQNVELNAVPQSDHKRREREARERESSSVQHPYIRLRVHLGPYPSVRDSRSCSSFCPGVPRFSEKRELTRVKTSPLFEIARVLVRLDHVASFIVNANHGIMRTAVEFRVSDCVAWRHRQYQKPPVSLENVLTVEFRVICSLEHGTTGTKHPAETPATPDTSVPTKATQASAATRTEFMAEPSLKPLKAILETIREQADFALKQLQESEEERSMRWKCKDCEYI